MIRTAERVNSAEISDNYVFQRSLLAYEEVAKRVYGEVLEIGTGTGYGLKIVAPKCTKLISIDKHKQSAYYQPCSNTECYQYKVPPFSLFKDAVFDFVFSLQVIEHVKKDEDFVEEIKRILKPDGKLIVSTPNVNMSLTRNPWHIREYTIEKFTSLLGKQFIHIEKLGVFGNDKVMDYYAKNKKAVEKITKFDILGLQHKLPRQLLQIPYDLLNRINRKKLLRANYELTSQISINDYFIKSAEDNCLDLFFIASN